jgi:hypothetical protein
LTFQPAAPAPGASGVSPVAVTLRKKPATVVFAPGKPLTVMAGLFVLT